MALRKFSVSKRRGITIGTIEHPVLEHTVGYILRGISADDDTQPKYYAIELKRNKGCVLYYTNIYGSWVEHYAKSIKELTEFLKIHEYNIAPDVTKLQTDPRNKWLGNDIMTLLKKVNVL